MSPQRLSQVAPGVDLRFGSSLIDAEPELASLAMRVISSWSYLEYWEARLLAAFLKADYDITYAMLAALQSSVARRAAVDAAARHALNDDDLALYERTKIAIKGKRKIRNRYTHSLWITSKHVPDALIMVDPRYMVRYHADALAYQSEFQRWVDYVNLSIAEMPRRDPKPGQVVRAPPEFDHSQCFVYYKADLERDVHAVRQADARVVELLVVLTEQDKDGSVRSRLERELPPLPVPIINRVKMIPNLTLNNLE